MVSAVRLNADVGEDPRAVVDGTQEALLALVQMANVACGGHAGDVDTMRATVEQCLRHRVQIGAHPSYPDRAGFGRRTLSMEPAALASSVREQVRALVDIAAACGARVLHVKPHGALYHDAARDPAVADALIAALADEDVHVVLIAGAPMSARFVAAGFAVVDEAFADRAYRTDGSLVPRTEPGALVTDPAAAASQAKRLVDEGRAGTLCVHGDTPGALAIARAVAAVVRA